VPFVLQPTLTGERLQLRPLRPDDWDALYAAASDPLIWAQHPDSERFKPDVFRRYFESGLASGGAFAVVDRRSGEIVGSSRYHDYDETKREVEIGWTFLTRDYWGGSYNREMKTLMLDHAFNFVERVSFNVGPTNYRSQRAMEKIGGVRAGTRVNSLGVESVVFVIVKGGVMKSVRQFFSETLKAEAPKFIRVLQAIPPDQAGYRPHPRCSSAGDIAWLLATELGDACELVHNGSANFTMHPAQPVPQAVALYEKNLADLQSRLAAIDDARWEQKAKFLVDGKVAWEAPLGDMLFGFLFDAIHHRGQLSSYLRPMGAKVPSIYGPSADDPGM
jgi:RimJ/RimL family protein N-acetyltransferase